MGFNDRRATILKCYSIGSISGAADVGGLVGGGAGTVANYYAEADVSGDVRVGGLQGDP